MRVAVFVVLVGCGRFGFAPVDDGRLPADAMGDGFIADAAVAVDGAPLDTPTAVCFGSGTFLVCFPAPPTGIVTLPSTIDTASSELCLQAQPSGWTQAGQPASCFIVGDQIVATAPVRVTGTRPLVLVAHDEMRLETLLDVASHRDELDGPGANPAACGAGSLPQSANSGGGGGAGGSFQTIGGLGGDGMVGVPGGTPAPAVSAPPFLRGGCGGQRGGDGAQQNSSKPGAGGGAVYIAAERITATNAVINASGAGASGIGSKCGGSGGGSGGMIVLWVRSGFSANSAFFVANGGGAAAGGAASPMPDAPGADPDPTMPLAPATGGVVGGARGGNGYARGIAASAGAYSVDHGGGGGGGGAGFILSNRMISSNSISPPMTPLP